MTTPPVSKRAHPTALDVVVTTLSVPGLGHPRGIFVLTDGNRLVASSWKCRSFSSSWKNTIFLQIAHFKSTYGLTVDRTGNVVVADFSNNAVRTVTRAGAVVSTVAGNGEAGFVHG